MNFKSLMTSRGGALGVAAALAAVAAVGAFTLEAQAQAPRGGRAGAPANTAAITVGQKYVMATHSFNVFVGPGRNGDPGPLAKLAAEAKLAGHENLAVQMIGNSTPMQHWNQGNGDDTKNIAKVALTKGGVDVFTMSPNAKMPEPGIALFGDLVIKTNPNARIMVQSSWSAWDGNATPSAAGLGGGAPQTPFVNADHDKATVDQLVGWRKGGEDYLARLRTQLDGINKRAGKTIAFVVPSSDAVSHLREQIVLGKVPGVTNQSDIFADAMGHPKTPLNHLVSYVWFAAMYRTSPVGMQALVDPTDPTSAAREKVLQQIAWNAVIAEPMSGVRGQQLALK
ncbi:hypothetical protein BH11PSE2_BH11PSE2_21900 [soil metagenome]